MRISSFFVVMFLCATALLMPLRIVHAASDLTDDMIAADARLSKAKVSVNRSHIYVGELLELWSKQTGVVLSTGAKDGSADETLIICVKDIPLKNAMQALWSLFSYRKAAWDWQREGDARTGYRYVLRQPFAARQLTATVREMAQKEFEADIDGLLAGLKQTPEERKKLAEIHPEWAQRLNDPVASSGIAAFASVLSVEEQRNVLRSDLDSKGGTLKDLSASNEAGRIYAAQYMQFKQNSNPGRVFTTPTKIKFFSEKSGSFAPSLMILLGDGSGMEGFDFGGGAGLRKKLRPQLEDLWILPPDRATSAQEAVVISPPQNLEQAKDDALGAPQDPERRKKAYFTKEGYANLFALRLRLIAEGSNTPLMARVTDPRVDNHNYYNDSKGEPFNQPMNAFLRQLNDQDMQHKWRGETVLLAPLKRLTMLPDEEREPWTLVKRLREMPAAPDGTYSAEQVAETAAAYSKQQIKNVYSSGSVTRSPGLDYWLEAMYDFFRCIGERPKLLAELRSPEGSRSALLLDAAVKPLYLGALPANDKAVALRVVEERKPMKTIKDGATVEVPVYSFTVQALSAQNKVVRVLLLPQLTTTPAVNAAKDAGGK